MCNKKKPPPMTIVFNLEFRTRNFTFPPGPTTTHLSRKCNMVNRPGMTSFNHPWCVAGKQLKDY